MAFAALLHVEYPSNIRPCMPANNTGLCIFNLLILLTVGGRWRTGAGSLFGPLKAETGVRFPLGAPCGVCHYFKLHWLPAPHMGEFPMLRISAVIAVLSLAGLTAIPPAAAQQLPGKNSCSMGLRCDMQQAWHREKL
jgi:hypothetical protein